MYVEPLERKVTELERKVDIMEKALKVLGKYVEVATEMDEIDQHILERLNERVTDLEDRTGTIN